VKKLSLLSKILLSIIFITILIGIIGCSPVAQQSAFVRTIDISDYFAESIDDRWGRTPTRFIAIHHLGDHIVPKTSFDSIRDGVTPPPSDLNPADIIIITSMEELHEYIFVFQGIDDVEPPSDLSGTITEYFRDRYDEEFFEYHDLVWIGFNFGGLVEFRLRDLAIDNSGQATAEVYWVPFTPPIGLYAYLTFWLPAEVEKGMLDGMTSAQLVFDYYDDPDYWP